MLRLSTTKYCRPLFPSSAAQAVIRRSIPLTSRAVKSLHNNPYRSFSSHYNSFNETRLTQPLADVTKELPESNQLADDYYGTNVFDRKTMKKYISNTDFNNYLDCILNYKSIPFHTADAIAAGVLKWATEKGATHFTHWFQPINGQNGEKHDTFVETLKDGETPLTRLTGKQFILGEPDGHLEDILI
jgi:glutamine synthetase type III